MQQEIYTTYTSLEPRPILRPTNIDNEIGDRERAHRINRDIYLTLLDEGISPVDFWLRFKEAAEIIGASHQ